MYFQIKPSWMLRFRNRRGRWIATFMTCLFLAVLLVGLYLGWSNIQSSSQESGMDSAKISSGATVISSLPALPDEIPPGEEDAKFDLSAEEAVKFNAGIPAINGKIDTALPFKIPNTPTYELSRSSAINCLTSAIYYEAASESERGQRAVAQVILNRVRHPAYPKSVCGVVFQGSERTTGCQFSFTCDGSMARTPQPAFWERAKRIAKDALSGKVEPSVGNATHYHTIWIVPYWAPSLQKLTTVGAHIFYRWTGYWGQPGAFKDVYAGENIPAILPDSKNPVTDMEYDAQVQLGDETIAFTPEKKRSDITTPSFKAGPGPTIADEANKITADENRGTLAADKEKGVLLPK